MKVRIILVDEHAIVREGLKGILSDVPDLEIVGEAQDGNEALEVIAEKKPDVVLLDISVPVTSGIECLRKIKKLHPETKVLALSMLDNGFYLVDLLNCGAEGYLIKNAGKPELVFAIQKIADGGIYIGPEFTMSMLARLKSQNGLAQEKKTEIRLNRGEREVLDLLMQGMTNSEMAEKLFTSVRTVETRRKKLLEKTGTSNTATLVKFALLKGLWKNENGAQA